jgi:type I restriction enzyme S subunit
MSLLTEREKQPAEVRQGARQWERVPLGSIVTFLDHLRRPVTATDRNTGPYPYFGANGQQGWIDSYLFDEELVLLAEDGGHFNDRSKRIAYRISGKSWVNNHAHVLRPSPGVDPSYLCRVLENYDVAQFVSGSTRAKLNKGRAEAMQIPLPPMGEQRRIAGILDVADGLRAKRRESIALLDTLTQSIFLDMFGDPSANDQGWTLTPLKEVLRGIDSGRSPVCLDREANDGEWGVLKLGAISSGRYLDAQNKALPLDSEPHRANEVREGDVLFSRKNTPQLVAKTAWVRATKPRMLLPDLIFRLVPGDALDPGYLSAVLSNPRLNARVRNLATGSAASMVNISKSKLLDFRIPVPPLYLQRRFVATTERVEGSRSLAQAYSSEMDSFFSSLQSRAFRGQL